ncbi:MAG: DUF4364 family protein [Clostridiales bacterium]|nr:DUF4364 family protein [Clostridiales bacterium]
MADLNNKNDIKIFILYILRHVGYALHYATIIDLVLGDGAVKYFDFVECFGELVEAGNIQRCDDKAEGEYKVDEDFVITKQGASVADTLATDLATYIRDKSLKRALQYLSFKRDGTKVKLDIKPLYDGRSRISFGFERNEESFFLLDLISDNEKQTERIRQNLDMNPENVYKSILSILSGDADYLFQ